MSTACQTYAFARQDSEPWAPRSPDNEDDGLKPARGVILGIAIGSCIWVIVISLIRAIVA